MATPKKSSRSATKPSKGVTQRVRIAQWEAVVLQATGATEAAEVAALNQTVASWPTPFTLIEDATDSGAYAAMNKMVTAMNEMVLSLRKHIVATRRKRKPDLVHELSVLLDRVGAT